MLRLDSTLRKLQIVLAGAITTNQLPVVVCYSDKTATAYTGGTTPSNTNSTTAVDICAAPAASTVRDIDSITVYNADTAAATATIRYNDNGTTYTLFKAALAVGDQLVYTHGQGWKVLDSSGNFKSSGSGSGVSDGDKGDITVSGSGATWTIDNDVVTYAKMQNVSATDKLLGRSTAGAGDVEEITCTAVGRAILDDSTTAAQRATLGILYTKGGRLTLSTGSPAMTSDVTGSTSIYYTPYIHDQIPLYDGSVFTMTEFTELTNTTTDATKSPAAVANNSNYDLFVWNDSGTLRLGRGPAWTSDSSRGVGAGTTEITRTKGIWLNANSITNGPAANRGTYVGTVRSNGTASIDWITTPAVDTPARLCVFNESNRILATGQARDSTNTWTYNSTTIRSARGVDNVRINVIFGLTEEPVLVQYNASMSGGASGDATVGIGVNSTTAYTGLSPYFSIGSNLGSAAAVYRAVPPSGFVFFQACEAQVTTASTATYVGDVGSPTLVQSGIVFMGNM